MRRVCICENVHFRFIYTPSIPCGLSYCKSYNYTHLRHFATDALAAIATSIFHHLAVPPLQPSTIYPYIQFYASNRHFQPS